MALGASMVYVEGGTFMMGATSEQGDDYDSDERPVHSVTLDGFYIGKYEVTQAQWKAVMGTSQSDILAETGFWSYGIGYDYPVYAVCWHDAVQFCEKLSRMTGKKYRLPTEAEWEYAARGGNKADGTKYAGSNTAKDVAWYGYNSSHTTNPVGQKRPNALGLYDMSGNVMEWCSDWYVDYSGSSAVNPQGPSSGSGRVQRGGCWEFPMESCRVSKRDHLTPSRRNPHEGFRVVCEP